MQLTAIVQSNNLSLKDKLTQIHRLLIAPSWSLGESDRLTEVIQLLSLADEVADNPSLRRQLNDCLEKIVLQPTKFEYASSCAFISLDRDPEPHKTHYISQFLKCHQLYEAYAISENGLYFLSKGTLNTLHVEPLKIIHSEDSFEALYADLGLTVFRNTDESISLLSSSITDLKRITRATGHVCAERQHSSHTRCARYHELVTGEFPRLSDKPYSTLEALQQLKTIGWLEPRMFERLQKRYLSCNREECLEKWLDIQYALHVLNYRNALSSDYMAYIEKREFNKNVVDQFYYLSALEVHLSPEVVNSIFSKIIVIPDYFSPMRALAYQYRQRWNVEFNLTLLDRIYEEKDFATLWDLEQSLWFLIEKNWVNIDNIQYFLSRLEFSYAILPRTMENRQNVTLIEFFNYSQLLIEGANDEWQKVYFDKIIQAPDHQLLRGKAVSIFIQHGLADTKTIDLICTTPNRLFLEALEYFDTNLVVRLSKKLLEQLFASSHPEAYAQLIVFLADTEIILDDLLISSLFSLSNEHFKTICRLQEFYPAKLWTRKVLEKLLEGQSDFAFLHVIQLYHPYLSSECSLRPSDPNFVRALAFLDGELNQPIYEMLQTSENYFLERAQLVHKLVKNKHYDKSQLETISKVNDVQVFDALSIYFCPQLIEASCYAKEKAYLMAKFERMKVLNEAVLQAVLEKNDLRFLQQWLHYNEKLFFSFDLFRLGEQSADFSHFLGLVTQIQGFHIRPSVEVLTFIAQIPSTQLMVRVKKFLKDCACAKSYGRTLHIDFEKLKKITDTVLSYLSEEDYRSIMNEIVSMNYKLFIDQTLEELISIFMDGSQNGDGGKEASVRQFLAYIRHKKIECQRTRRNQQNTHEKTIHFSASETAKSFQSHYGELTDTQVTSIYEAIFQWHDQHMHLDDTDIMTEALHSIRDQEIGAYIDPISQISVKMLLAYDWIAIQDEGLRIGSEEELRQELRNEICTGQRIYNTNPLDFNETSQPECPPGLFNRLASVLVGAHPLAKQILVTAQTISDAFVARVSEVIFNELENQFLACRLVHDVDELLELIENIKTEASIMPIWSALQEKACLDFWNEFATTGELLSQNEFKSRFPSPNNSEYLILCDTAQYIDFPGEGRLKKRLDEFEKICYQFKIRLLFATYFHMSMASRKCQISMILLFLISLASIGVAIAFSLQDTTTSSKDKATKALYAIGSIGTFLSASYFLLWKNNSKPPIREAVETEMENVPYVGP